MNQSAEIMNRVRNNVKMLVDVAHLKVSSNSLNFDRISFLKKLDKWILLITLAIIMASQIVMKRSD